MRPANEREQVLIRAAVARLRAGIIAIVCGLFSGVALFVATLWLVVRGGPNVGQHLNLLNNYFPGYSVTVTGAFLGLFYGAAAGALVGWFTAFVYNRVAGRREAGDLQRGAG